MMSGGLCKKRTHSLPHPRVWATSANWDTPSCVSPQEHLPGLQEDASRGRAGQWLGMWAHPAAWALPRPHHPPAMVPPIRSCL